MQCNSDLDLDQIMVYDQDLRQDSPVQVHDTAPQPRQHLDEDDGEPTAPMRAGGRYKDRKTLKCRFKDCDTWHSCQFNLAQHERTHTGERPYPCREPFCGRAFTRQWLLNRHCKSKHAKPAVETPKDNALEMQPGSDDVYLPEYNPSPDLPLPAPYIFDPSLPDVDFDPVSPFEYIPDIQEDTPGDTQGIPGVDETDMQTWTRLVATPPAPSNATFVCSQCNSEHHTAMDLQCHHHIHHQLPPSENCTCSICIAFFIFKEKPWPFVSPNGDITIDPDLLLQGNHSEY